MHQPAAHARRASSAEFAGSTLGGPSSTIGLARRNVSACLAGARILRKTTRSRPPRTSSNGLRSVARKLCFPRGTFGPSEGHWLKNRPWRWIPEVVHATSAATRLGASWKSERAASGRVKQFASMYVALAHRSLAAAPASRRGASTLVRCLASVRTHAHGDAGQLRGFVKPQDRSSDRAQQPRGAGLPGRLVEVRGAWLAIAPVCVEPTPKVIDGRSGSHP